MKLKYSIGGIIFIMIAFLIFNVILGGICLRDMITMIYIILHKPIPVYSIFLTSIIGCLLAQVVLPLWVITYIVFLIIGG